jgi:hypothetical protein
MTKKIANIYIDEFGNTSLNVKKAGTFSHFIYCSFIIDSTDREKAEKLRQKIAKENRLGPDIKSNNLGAKYFDRRLKILNELMEGLDFSIDIMVIDKEKLSKSEGLKRKQIFYKYFQNFFVKKYNDKFDSFNIWADKVGEDFQFELQDYIRRESAAPTLFYPDRFFFMSDDIEKEKLIQFADIICGSLGQVFCTSHTSARSQEIYDILHTRLSIEYYPYHSNAKDIKHSEFTKYDDEIIEITLKIAFDQWQNFRIKNKNEEARLLEFLLMNYKIDSSRLIPTWEITTYLGNFFLGSTDEKTRTLVRNLRYHGVFVISQSGKTGYKLANCYSDITQQFEHYLKYVVPMLTKIKILNSSIAERTINSLNILEGEQSFKDLSQMLKGIK